MKAFHISEVKNMTNTMCAKLELALMGRVVKIDEEVLADALDYIASAVGHTEISGAEIASRFCDTKPVAISCSRVEGMPCVNIILVDEGETLDLGSNEGVYCYVYNFAEPCFSEFGYSFFEKVGSGKNSYYHRYA